MQEFQSWFEQMVLGRFFGAFDDGLNAYLRLKYRGVIEGGFKGAMPCPSL
jgi:hypothetical protein